MIKEKLTHLDS
jgi:hypothetical protein